MHSGSLEQIHTCNLWSVPYFTTTLWMNSESGMATSSLSVCRILVYLISKSLLIHRAAADAGSVYEPHPILMYEWNPEQMDNYQRPRTTTSTSFDLGPHPADPHSLTSAILHTPFKPGPFTQCQQVPGHEIWVYAGRGGYVDADRFTLLRSDIHD